ncbi:MAG: ROK family protein [Caldilineae bacterium]|nr:MAG: ROK family protein [Caldilineae bacterium]
MPDLVIALDVGGSSVKSGVVQADHTVYQRRTTPIDSSGPAESILATLAAIIDGHARTLGKDAVLRGVGLGFPGPFDYAQGVCYIHGVAKYEALYGLHMDAELRARLAWGPKPPIRFRNDAEAAIIGEFCYGAGRSFVRGIGVTLGTGFGSTFVVEGKPQRAGPGVPPNGWLYAESWQGQQADDVFSARGLQARLAAAFGRPLDIPTAAQRARVGDQQLQEVFRRFGADLGAFLYPYARAFDAHVVLILGGIAHAMDLFETAVAQALRLPVRGGALGPDAALLGAAELFFA